MTNSKSITIDYIANSFANWADAANFKDGFAEWASEVQEETLADLKAGNIEQLTYDITYHTDSCAALDEYYNGVTVDDATVREFIESYKSEMIEALEEA